MYIFADSSVLLDLVYEETLSAKPQVGEERETRQWKFGKDELDSIGQLKVNKEKETAQKEKKTGLNSVPDTGIPGRVWQVNAEVRLGVSLSESKEFNGLWWHARRYLLYVDNLLRDLAPIQDRLKWFIDEFKISKDAATTLQGDRDVWSKGGLGKYVLIVADHFLKGALFAERPAEQRPAAEVLDLLHQHVLQSFGRIDLQADRKAATDELGFYEELRDYLQEHLLHIA